MATTVLEKIESAGLVLDTVLNAAKALADGPREASAGKSIVDVITNVQDQPMTWQHDPKEQVKHLMGHVAAAIRPIATTVQASICRLYKSTGPAAEEREEIFDHPWLSLMRNVNPIHTKSWLWEATVNFMELTGNCFWYTPLNRMGIPGEIWVMHSQYMSVVPGGDFIKEYIFQCGAKKMKFKPEEILHFKFHDPASWWYGLGPLQKAAYEVDSNEYIKKAQRRAFQIGIFPAGKYKIEKDLNTPEKDRIKSRLALLHAGDQNAGNTLVLGKHEDYVPISLKPKEMDFFMSGKLTRSDIYAIFGTPASVTGVAEDVNKHSGEVMYRLFTRQTVHPLLRLFEDQINQDVMPKYGNPEGVLYVEYDSPVPEDREEERNDDEMLVKNNVVTRDEVRVKRGYEARGAGMDRAYIEVSRVAISEEGLEDEEPEPEETEQEKLLAAARSAVTVTTAKAPRLSPDDLLDWEKAAKRWEKLGKRHISWALKNGALQEMDDVGLDPGSFDLENELSAEFMKGKNRDYWKGKVNKTTREKLGATLAEGMAQGEGARELAKRVRETFKDAERYRALRIARTETIGAHNEGGHEVRILEGIPYKTWIASGDDRTRDSHDAISSTTIKSKLRFKLAGGSLMYPGDSSGPSEEVVNCRCTCGGAMSAKGISQEAQEKIGELFLRAVVKRSPAFVRDCKKEFRREMKDALENLRRKLS